MRQHHPRQPGLLHLRKSRHIGVGQHIGGMLVIAGMRNGNTHLVQRRRPSQQRGVLLGHRLHRDSVVQLPRKFADAFGLPRIDMVATHKLAHRHLAHVLALEASDHVVKHALAQRTIGNGHALYAQLGKNRPHDGAAPGEHLAAVSPHTRNVDTADITRPDKCGAKFVQPVKGDALTRPAIGLQNARKRLRRSGRTDRFIPAQLPIGLHQGLHLAARRQLRLFEALLVNAPVGEKFQARADTTDMQTFHQQGLQCRTDDAFG